MCWKALRWIEYSNVGTRRPLPGSGDANFQVTIVQSLYVTGVERPSQATQGVSAARPVSQLLSLSVTRPATPVALGLVVCS